MYADARSIRRRALQRFIGAALVVCGALAMAGTGCADARPEIERLSNGVRRIPLGTDDGVVRFFLAWPSRWRDPYVWWYLRPDPQGPASPTGGASVVIRFDDHKKVRDREWFALTTADAGRRRVDAERLARADAAEPENDFAAILGDKLAEVARANPRYHFESQQASYQFLADGALLLTMDRWTRDGSWFVSVRGEIDLQADPQVFEAILLAWRIRRFAIELDLETPASTVIVP